MIRVIKHSSKTFKGICPHCYCEFTYEPEDMKDKLQIQCPDCGYFVCFDKLFDEDTKSPIPYVTDNPLPYVTPGFVYTKSCDNCSWYKEMLSDPDKVYIGDTPCTWCDNYRITCATAYFSQCNAQTQGLSEDEIKMEVNNDHSN